MIDVDGAAIQGLYAAGWSGPVYFNYPGGAGLMAAAVLVDRRAMAAQKALHHG